MLGTTVSVIQKPSGNGAMPLILIHDGGGTCFSYRLLGQLGRAVYTIENPRFQSGRPWKGGIQEMAEVYVELIRCMRSKGTLPTESFLLGGWSLGGLISLQIAKLLEGDDELRVAGILMIDSVFPATQEQMERAPQPICANIPDSKTSWPAETRVAVLRSFKQTAAMLQLWTPPTWDDSTSTSLSSGSTTPSSEADFWDSSSSTSDSGFLREISSIGSSSPIESKDDPKNFAAQLDARFQSYLGPSSSTTRPATVLLRASEVAPAPAGTMCRVDLHRDDRDLGWQEFERHFFNRVVDIPGHHFNLFVPQNVGVLTDELKDACHLINSKWTELHG
ncbi:putative thioesterase gloN [Cladobotryum mycophilum]|uniref:Thioesterase gloN n=1 Tax=Cladobotryum mycophilum TaxID=491253 RepID=A0ABR0T5M8_9HYPO